MAYYTAPLSTVLKRLTQTVSVNVEDYDGTGEWFWVSSDDLADDQLYYKLKVAWPRFAGVALNQLALIHCETGDDSGVWLHYLGNADARREYAVGCHKIPSWD
jgi:hypothetical protein